MCVCVTWVVYEGRGCMGGWIWGRGFIFDVVDPDHAKSVF